jgi:YggT family protein
MSAAQQSLIFILNALLQYLLVTAYLLRVLLPLVRADMRNPLSQAILRVTNPLVMPLRKIVRPIGRMDTSAVLALCIVQLLTTLLIVPLSRYFGLAGADRPLPLLALRSLVETTLQFYFIVILVYALLSWVAPHTHGPGGDILGRLTGTILRPIRRVIPPIAGLDLSTVFALIGLQALLLFVVPAVFG